VTYNTTKGIDRLQKSLITSTIASCSNTLSVGWQTAQIFSQSGGWLIKNALFPRLANWLQDCSSIPELQPKYPNWNNKQCPLFYGL